jgi:hypothetical protein
MLNIIVSFFFIAVPLVCSSIEPYINLVTLKKEKDISPLEKRDAFRVLMCAIDSLPKDFSPQKLTEVNRLFKEAAQIEKQKNEKLELEVKKFSELLDSVTHNTTHTDGGKIAPPDADMNLNKIKSLLDSILKELTG